VLLEHGERLIAPEELHDRIKIDAGVLARLPPKQDDGLPTVLDGFNDAPPARKDSLCMGVVLSGQRYSHGIKGAPVNLRLTR